ncbi:MAG: hypothetical protein C0622_04605 [Desulfuromonas sp.]|nr:MAG: hypothetical protein C0622_04605 [Desulfuromonas sp.]
MNPLWQNIFRSRGYENTLAYFLSTVPAFSKLDKRDLAVLEHLVHVRNYTADEVVFSEGDIGSGMYIIRSGQVRIYTQDDLEQTTDKAVLETGDFFGETALTASRPRCASAKATESTVLVGLFRSDVEEAIRRHPLEMAKIMFGLNRVISDRLLQCSLQLDKLMKLYGTEQQ